MTTKNELINENRNLKKELKKYKNKNKALTFSTVGALAVSGFSIGAAFGSVEATPINPTLALEHQDMKTDDIQNETESTTYIEENEINEKISDEDMLLASSELECSYDSNSNDYDYDYDNYFVDDSTPSQNISPETNSIQEDITIEKEEVNASVTSIKEDYQDELSNEEVANKETSVEEALDKEASDEDIITLSQAEKNIFNLFEEGVNISLTRLGGKDVIFDKGGTNPIQQMLGSNGDDFEFEWNHEFYLNSYNYKLLGCYENTIKLAFDIQSMNNVVFANWDKFQAAIKLSSEECDAIFKANEMEFAYSIKRMKDHMQRTIHDDNEALKNALKSVIQPLIGNFELEIEFSRFRK